MNSEVVQIKCKGCLKLFPIYSIRNHLRLVPQCKGKHSEEDCKTLEQQYNSYRKKQLHKIYIRKKNKTATEVKSSNYANSKYHTYLTLQVVTLYFPL